MQSFRSHCKTSKEETISGPRRRWDDNIKMYQTHSVSEWAGFIWVRLRWSGDTCEKSNKLSHSIKSR